MDAFGVLNDALADYRSFVTGFLNIQDDRVRAKVDDEIEDGLLWPEPWLALNPAFESGGTVTELVDRSRHRTGFVFSSVSVIDTDPTSATYNEQIATIALPGDDQGIFYSDYNGVFDVALSPDGSRAYVTSFDGKTVAVIDTASNTLIGTFTIDEGEVDSNLRRSIAVGADGTLYIADGDGTVYAVTVSEATTAV